MRWSYSRLVGQALAGTLSRDRHAAHAHLSRLSGAEQFLHHLRFLLWIPRVDVLLQSLVFVLCARVLRPLQYLELGLALLASLILPLLVRHPSPGTGKAELLLDGYLAVFPRLWGIFEFTSGAHFSPPLKLFFLWCCFWRSLSYVAAYLGASLSPVLWLLAPLWIFVALGRYGREILASAVQYVRSEGTLNMVRDGLQALFVLVVTVITLRICALLLRSELAANCIAALLCMGLGGLLIYVCRILVADKIRWNAAQPLLQRTLSFDEFLQTLSGFSTDYRRVLFVMLARKHRALASQEGVAAALREMITIVELAVLANPKKQSIEEEELSGESVLPPAKHPDVLAWLQRINASSKKLSGWSMEVLEALCQLYETVSQRDDELSSAARRRTAA
jgi:hypothetical protein